MNVLVTGGCGYIGSHQVVALLEAGHEVCVVDDLSNSSLSAVDRASEVANRPALTHCFDVRDTARLRAAITGFGAEAIIHFAAYKHVGESTQRALDYHLNNVGGLLSVLQAASSTGVRKLVFSSSGSVYGEADRLPISEDQPHKPTNPYSATKSICERVLSDVCASDRSWRVTALRYFNPAGAHPSGLLGEDPSGPICNLVPALMRTAMSPDPTVEVFGCDFDTPDGSGVRDYIHVVDVAATHLQALEKLGSQQGFVALNVGRGVGVSVLDMVAAVEHASCREIRVESRPRRPGDVAALYGDTAAARRYLGPMTYRGLDEICADAWRWQAKSLVGGAPR